MGRGRITVTPGFLFLMAWCNYADQQGLLLPALAGCALHELGHLAAIWGLGGSVRRLRLTAVGAEIQMERPMSYPGELAAALAGPAANLAAAWLCCRAEGGALFAGLNLALGCFNLLPVGRLDGGRALHCLLSMSIGPAAEEAVRSGPESSSPFAGAGRAPDRLGRQFYPPPGGALAAGKEKEGKRKNRSCQGLQKQVKWFPALE